MKSIRWYAELAVDNAEGATQVKFDTEHGYRETIIRNVERAMELLLKERNIAP